MNSLNATRIKVRPSGGKWKWCLLDKFDTLIDHGDGCDTKKEAQQAGVDAKEEYKRKLSVIAKKPRKEVPPPSLRRLIFIRRQRNRGDLE